MIKKERRLWIFEHYAVPPTMSGFMRQHDHAHFLEKHGWTSTVFASAYNHKAHKKERDVSPIRSSLSQNEQGVEFSWLYTVPYTDNDWRRYLNMASYMASAQLASFGKERPDVVLGSSPHLLAALAGWLIACRLRVPFIFEVQDLWPESLVQLGLSNKPIVKTLEIIEKFLYQKADAIIGLTDGVCSGVRAKSAPDKRIVLIPNGASVRGPIDDTERSRQRSARGWDGQYVVIWTGAHGKANHLDTLVEAARILSDSRFSSLIRLVLVGDGPEKARLKNNAAGLDNIEFLDPVSGSEVPVLLQLADVGIIVHSDTPAVRGARPTKLTEYMAAGLPIISNLQEEAEGLINQANCGWTVPTMRPDLIAAAVESAYLNREHTSELGKNGIKFVQETHDREMLADKLAGLLDEVVSQ